MSDVFEPSMQEPPRPRQAGVIIGAVLALGVCGVLWLTESLSVDAARALERGGGSVVSVSADRVDAAHEGRLVHVTGRAVPGTPPRDAEFGVTADALTLVRTVEMYQWLQTETSTFDQKRDKKLGPYRYHTAWADHVVDSSAFWSPHGHQNPGSLAWSSRTFTPERVSLGAFTLPRAVLEKLTGTERLAVTTAQAAALAPSLGLRVWNGELHTGGNPNDPAVGDIRVAFSVVPAREVTVVARQVGSSFEPFPTDDGRSILLVDSRSRTAAEMIGIEKAGSRVGGWILDLIGVLFLWPALWLTVRPFVRAGAPVPVVDALVRPGPRGFAFGGAIVITALIVAAAWATYQPSYALGALVVAAAIAGWLLRRAHRAPQSP